MGNLAISMTVRKYFNYRFLTILLLDNFPTIAHLKKRACLLSHPYALLCSLPSLLTVTLIVGCGVMKLVTMNQHAQVWNYYTMSTL